MQPISGLLLDLRWADVELWLESGRLRYRATKGLLSQRRVQEIRGRESEILSFLRAQELEAMEPDLEATDYSGPLPIASIQERFFWEYGRVTDPASLHLSRVIRLSGPLDPAAFLVSVRRLAERHSVLRTKYVQADGMVYATVDDFARPDAEIVDVRAASEAQGEDRAREIFSRTLATPFNLDDGRLFRIRLVRLGESEHILIIVMHHVVSDAQSMQIVIEDLAGLYGSVVLLNSVPLPKLEIQYGDYALWQRKVEAVLGERLLDHWRERFQGLAQDPYWLPADSNPGHDPSRSFFGDRTSFPLIDQLRQLARSLHSTTFSVVMAAVCILLGKWSGRDDVLVATHWNGRDRREQARLIGCFAQLHALRIRTSARDRFSDVVKTVHRVYREDLPYRKLPYLRIKQNLLSDGIGKPPPETLVNYIPFAGAMRENRDADSVTETWDVQPLEWRQVDPVVNDRNFRIYFTFMEGRNALEWHIRFSSKYFRDRTIDAVSWDLHRLLDCVARQPETPLSDLHLAKLQRSGPS